MAGARGFDSAIPPVSHQFTPVRSSAPPVISEENHANAAPPVIISDATSVHQQQRLIFSEGPPVIIAVRRRSSAMQRRTDNCALRIKYTSQSLSMTSYLRRFSRRTAGHQLPRTNLNRLMNGLIGRALCHLRRSHYFRRRRRSSGADCNGGRRLQWPTDE